MLDYVVVVDASVACKWFFHENHSAEANALLASELLLVAPSLIVVEVSNVIWKRLRTGDTSIHQVERMLWVLEKVQLVPVEQLARRAVELAGEINHSPYDCFYLALCERRNARMVTDDQRLINKVQSTPWGRHLVTLPASASLFAALH